MEVSNSPSGASPCPQQEWKRNSMPVKKRFEEDFKFEGLSIKQSPATEPPSCVYEAVIYFLNS